MTYATGSLHGPGHSGYAWIAPAAFTSAGKAGRYFVSLMKHSAARERARKELAQLDVRMLQDIGLEPFEVYYGWRGVPRSGH
ncbi:DUF1127 domain-containing protein [Microvirga sp. 2YAF29]|uniref:DUF1127 domain-containing protein n=1 Tax=Microvirga sp. 2YAF29 TaxID=3233031 RepID=UPI003F9B83C2